MIALGEIRNFVLANDLLSADVNLLIIEALYKFNFLWYFLDF
jgi:hypothetical protein